MKSRCPAKLFPTALAATLLIATAARAQPPQGDVGPDDIRKTADRLRALHGGLPPDLFNKILELKRNNPGMSNDELAKKLLDENPALNDPAMAGKLQEWMRQGQGGDGRWTPPSFEPNLGGPANPPGRPPVKPPASVQFPKQPSDTAPPRIGRPPIEPIRPLPPDFRPPGPMDFGQARPPGPGGAPPGRPGPPRNGTVTPEQLDKRQQQFRAVAGWWEKNVGPLNETPAVKDLLMEMFTGQGGSGEGTVGELLEGSEGEGFAKFAETLEGSGFKLPDLGFHRDDFGFGDAGNFAPPPSPSGGSVSGFGGEGSWLPVILFLAVAGGGLVLWWLWPRLTAGKGGPRPLPGLGPWPVDPRTIADREALVKAFEYLSVLLCGPGARVWNHMTIAAALERVAPQAEALAEPLARLYELARYTPADQPLPPGAIAEARGYLCDLAGVPAP